MSQIFEKLVPYMNQAMAFQAALTLFEWDQETLAPALADEYTANVIGEISQAYQKIMIDEQVKKLLEKLKEEKNFSELTENEKAIVKEWNIIVEQLDSIPEKEYSEYARLQAKAGNIWEKAKEEGDFSKFAPCLEEIINYKKKFISYRRKKGSYKKKKDYDILLGDYEPEFNMEKLDKFFHEVKQEIIPLLKKVEKKNTEIDKSFNHQSYEINKQREFCQWLAAYVGFDFSKGVIGESAHPFSTNLHNHDVRISNHFYENNLESAIFSIIHETGHAMYEQGIDSDITLTLIGTGTSMAMHESQSRFFENMIGRSESFWTYVYPKLQKTFPDNLRDVSLEQFISGINKAEPGLIRTEADELTYSLHVLIRYEIEKMIFQEDVKIKDLPKIWNEKYKEYLGLVPSHDGEGILQDIHWACGDFGYFPSYAIGSAVSAQIYHHLEKIMPVNQYLEEGNLLPIREFLKEHVYQHGKRKSTNEILLDITGEEFNSFYYIEYLKQKFQ
ncbi:MAG: carboxypeptidase M32 [Lachnospiraceae bacterium]|nr:carboxypeptidase M32 [Lachnospiraceae bacterium]